jgi:hypothetical protein
LPATYLLQNYRQRLERQQGVSNGDGSKAQMAAQQVALLPAAQQTAAMGLAATIADVTAWRAALVPPQPQPQHTVTWL